MSDDSNPEIVTESTEDKKTCGTHSACKPHTSLYLSVIALLLSAYAAFTAANSAAPTDGEARLESLEYSVQNMDEQIIALSKDVESNRDNLIQNQLKKALLNIQEISGLAKEETKATIAEVEKTLHALTSPTAASEATGEEAPQTEASVPVTATDEEIAPATETTPESDQTERPTTETVVDEVIETVTETTDATEPSTEVPPAAEAPTETPAVEAPTTETPTEQPDAAAPAVPVQPETQAF